MGGSTRDASVQASALVLAALSGLFGALSGASAAAWALYGYLGAWLLFHVAALRFSRAALRVFSATGLLIAAFNVDELIDEEYWGGTAAHIEDQARLQHWPAIAPSVVFGDHPQEFYIATLQEDDEALSEVRVRLGPRGATLPGVALGHGLYRVHYDPRRHGEVAEADGPARATLFIGDAATTRTLQYVAPLSHPRALCTSPERSLAASPSLESDQLFTVDAAGRVRAFDVGDGPVDCAFVDEERIVVAHRFGPTLWVVGRDGQVLRRVQAPAVHRLAVSPNQNQNLNLNPSPVRPLIALAHAGSVSLLDAQTFEIVGTLDVADVDQLTFVDEDTLILARRRDAELLRYRRHSNRWTRDGSLALGRPAVTMEGSGDSRVVVSVTDYVPSGEPHFGNHFVQDQLLTIDTDLMRVTNQEITARRSPRQSSAGDVDRGLSPMGLHVDGEDLLVAFAGSDETWVLRNGALPEMGDTADIPAPEGITRLRDNSGVSLILTSPSAGLIATRRDSRSYDDSDRWRVVALDDRENSPRRRGQRAFYEGTRAGISCQSCHLHGDTDFVLRNIGGQRLAPTLGVGGIADTAPFLRDGSYPRIRDLQHLATTLFRGYLRYDARRGVDIEAYVRALPRRPVAVPEHDSARERRGLDVFAAADCATCHSFPAFTNLAQIPSGVLFPELEGRGDEVLDTPSLLSVSTHSPYLSDGRAEDLRSIFADHNPSNRHGNTAGLSEAQLADLVYFLERL